MAEQEGMRFVGPVEWPHHDLQSSPIDKIATALAKAQGEIGGAIEDKENPFLQSKYADLKSIWKACRRSLADNNLAITQTHDGGPDQVTVITTLMHSSGQWVRGYLSMRPLKVDPQSIGSCITYCRRYALAAMVGVYVEDDDGEDATRDDRPVRETQPKPRTVTKTAQGSNAINGTERLDRAKKLELFSAAREFHGDKANDAVSVVFSEHGWQGSADVPLSLFDQVVSEIRGWKPL